MKQEQTNAVIEGCGFHHVAVRTSDWAGSMKFWTDGMGFFEKISWGQAPRRAVMLDTGDGNYLELFEREALENLDADSPIIHFCLRAKNVDKAFARAVEAGAAIVSEPKDPPVFAEKGLKVRIAFIKGPGGEVCEFFQCDEL